MDNLGWLKEELFRHLWLDENRLLIPFLFLLKRPCQLINIEQKQVECSEVFTDLHTVLLTGIVLMAKVLVLMMRGRVLS